MSYQKRTLKFTEIGMLMICTLAVFLSVFSIYSTYRIQQTASSIYEHPYTVSNEARAMRSRLLDMKGFLINPRC